MSNGQTRTVRFVWGDIIVEDDRGRPILAVEIKGRPLGTDDLMQAVQILMTSDPAPAFAMLVDPVRIAILPRGVEANSARVCTLETADVLSFYEPEYCSKRIFADYLQVLVEGWLRDLAHHWKSAEPPGSKALAAVGLLDQLGTDGVSFEITYHGDPVR